MAGEKRWVGGHLQAGSTGREKRYIQSEKHHRVRWAGILDDLMLLTERYQS